VLFVLWRWQQKHGGEPGEIGKMATGAWMAAAANVLLVLASLPGGRVSGIFPVVYDVILGIAFLYYWPTLLALVSHAAPTRLKSTMMGVAYLSLFIGNLIVGRLGSLYESLGPASFWMVHAAIAATGAVLCMLLARPLGKVLAAPA
jgi:POT family proton-dependent oligopeptide transporter